MSPSAKAALVAFEAFLPRGLSQTIDDLESYSALLHKWQRVQNLVSRETLIDVWTRHFSDSLQILQLLHADDRRFLDLGSGGGLPALPMAIALKGQDVDFTLVEPNTRKVSFLRTVARELSLPVTVINSRSDQIDPRETLGFNIITSRALAPLPLLCEYMAPFFTDKTRALLHKGREHVEELAESGAVWHHDVIINKSSTDVNGVIIELKNLRLKNR